MQCPLKMGTGPGFNHICSNASTAPARFMRDLLYRRDEMLEHAAGADVDLGAEQHAGDET